MWVRTVGNEIIDCFKADDSVKINSENYCILLKRYFLGLSGTCHNQKVDYCPPCQLKCFLQFSIYLPRFSLKMTDKICFLIFQLIFLVHIQDSVHLGRTSQFFLDSYTVYLQLVSHRNLYIRSYTDVQD